MTATIIDRREQPSFCGLPGSHEVLVLQTETGEMELPVADFPFRLREVGMKVSLEYTLGDRSARLIPRKVGA